MAIRVTPLTKLLLSDFSNGHYIVNQVDDPAIKRIRSYYKFPCPLADRALTSSIGTLTLTLTLTHLTFHKRTTSSTFNFKKMDY